MIQLNAQISFGHMPKNGNQFYLEAICTSESDGKNDSTG